MNTHYLPYYTGWIAIDKNYPDAILPTYQFLPSIVRTFRSKYRPHVGKKQQAKVAMKPNSKPRP